jgi:hypothetical protein
MFYSSLYSSWAHRHPLPPPRAVVTADTQAPSDLGAGRGLRWAPGLAASRPPAVVPSTGDPCTAPQAGDAPLHLGARSLLRGPPSGLCLPPRLLCRFHRSVLGKPVQSQLFLARQHALPHTACRCAKRFGRARRCSIFRAQVKQD